MTKESRYLTDEKSIMIKEERKIEMYSDYKKQYGDYMTYEVDVPGVQSSYLVTYHCKKCGSDVNRSEVVQRKL